MVTKFYEQPILNSPYEYPGQHWEMDSEGQPTHRIKENRRGAEFFTPIPKPRKRGGGQRGFVMDEGEGLSTENQQYAAVAEVVNGIRQQVDAWRTLPNEGDWGVTSETGRLLKHWRHHAFSGVRPFFCQREAAETIIWLTEVAPKGGLAGQFLENLRAANAEANPELMRLALKLATGAGKTTVMAMLIAWQTINAVRHPRSNKFTKGFLVVAPGITIKDRLRVLQPNDPDSYYQSRELVPPDMAGDLGSAEIVITNFHALRLRETLSLSSGGRALLQGRGPELSTVETDGQMMQRVMPKLMGMKNIMVLNDEGHHCYRQKPGEDAEGELKGDDLKEAQKNREEARVWISGLEMVQRKLGIRQVIDLSATPFFLRGSGYAEGTLFPWTVSDFSLMDAIESGIVKLPRVPVADNIPGDQAPVFRNLWENIRKDMPKAGRGKAGNLDPLALPTVLQTALEALYGHYKETYEAWERPEGTTPPPCFIVVCNNTSTSKLVYDYISGFQRQNENGSVTTEHGRLSLFDNFDELGNRHAMPRTLLIDSQQLESGEKLSDEFKKAAEEQIGRFKRERVHRTGKQEDAENITDEELLREVMNTVGKRDTLGQNVRCVVSVSMLTEGWDANTVTHILGVRAFGTQLLCEQVVGRALRRQSYELNDDGKFDVEYADVLGIPFDFAAQPVVAGKGNSRQTTHVTAVRPERDRSEITFPRVTGYRENPPKEELVANFTKSSRLDLTPALVGPTKTRNEGIIGEGVDLNLVHTNALRTSSLVMHLTKRLLETKWRDTNEGVPMHLFGRMQSVVREWLETCLVCRGGTYPAQLMYLSLADRACNHITAAITSRGERSVKALLDPYNPTGSTSHVNFTTSKTDLWRTDARKCHINWVVLDSSWEGEFCRVAEAHPRVVAYVKNHNMGFEVPYLFGSTPRTYVPDFILKVNDGREDLLNLVVEIKGFRGEDAKIKKETMEAYWLPGINAMGEYGRWGFAEFTDFFDIEAGFGSLIERAVRESESYDYSGLNFKEMLVAGPSFDDLDLTRSPDRGRDVSFLADENASYFDDIERRRSAEFADFLTEEHRRQWEEFMEFREFERGLPDRLRHLNDRERYLLFLEQESHRSAEGRKRYLQFLEYERPYLDQYHPDALRPWQANDNDSD